jgi:hypothetical protein
LILRFTRDGGEDERCYVRRNVEGRNLVMRSVMTMLLSFLLVLSMGFASVAIADKVDSFKWDEVTKNEDETPITDLAGYNIYCGTVSKDYTITVNVGLVLIFPIVSVLGDKADGIYYCALTAYDVVRNESVRSDEVVLKKSVDFYDGNDIIAPEKASGFGLQ